MQRMTTFEEWNSPQSADERVEVLQLRLRRRADCCLESEFASPSHSERKIGDVVPVVILPQEKKQPFKKGKEGRVSGRPTCADTGDGS